MHNSMKNNSDGGKAQSAVHKSAEIMMDKTQRNGKKNRGFECK